jgi:hypothetical protein
VHRRFFLRRRAMLNTAGAAAEGYMARIGYGRALNDGAINKRVVNDGGIHVDHGSVVGEETAAPLATGKADAEIAAPVIHAAVVADGWSPIALVKYVEAVGPSPVTRRPIGANVGGGNPCAGHPVVVAIAAVVGPVAWSPHQVGLRADGLLIDGQHRRSEVDADQYPGLNRCRDQQRCNCKQQNTGRSKESHELNLLDSSGPRRRERCRRANARKSIPPD